MGGRECPDGWRIVTVGDVADVKGGKRLPKGAALSDRPTPHPYIRVRDLKDGSIDTSALQYVPRDVFPLIRRYTISSDDVYISIVGTIGLCGTVPAQLDGASLTENAAKITRLSKDVDRRYLAAYLRSPIGQAVIGALTVGAVQPKLALFRVKNIALPLPPLPEQKAIAHVLGTLDDKIELNRRMNETLEAMARAIFKSWFVDFDPVWAKKEGRQPVGMDAETAALFPDDFEDSELGPIPRGWEVKALDEVAEFVNGIACQKYPATGPESLPVIKIRELRQGVTEATDRAALDVPGDRIVDDGDVLFSWSGSLELVVWAQGRGVLNQHVFLVKSDLYPRWCYFHWVLQHLDDFRAIAADKATTMGHIKREHLSNALVASPPAKLLARAERTVGWAFDRALANQLQGRTLTEARDALLPKLVSGELRVGGQVV